MNQTSNHMDTKIFTWKPSDWGENHGSSTIFKNLLCQIRPWLGQQPLTIYLKENTDSCFTILLPGTNRKGHQPLQAYWVGPSTTLPPCNDKWEGKTQGERLKTDSVQALQTTINVTVSSEKLTWLTNPSRQKDWEDSTRLNQTNKKKANQKVKKTQTEEGRSSKEA